jgi:hypothetical protein
MSRIAELLPTPIAGPLHRAFDAVAPHAGRLRWATKARTLRQYRGSLLKDPALSARYVLLDPEIDNFTYDLANLDELAEFLAEATGAPRDRVDGLLREAEMDPLLQRPEPLRRRLDRKRRPRYGRRLGWYVLARLQQPAVIVETGIHDGLGSLLLLRALERNAAEGHPGELLSFDIDPQTGWVVAPRHQANWTRVIGPTTETLEAAVAGLSVGMLIHDSEHTYECERFEFGVGLAHRAYPFTLVSDNAHATPALKDVCHEQGFTYRYFAERPAQHFYPGAGLGLAIAP